MKRDMNLIRLLLLELEGEDPKPDLSNYSEKQQVYHIALLLDAGLVIGRILEDGEGNPASSSVTRMTWAGHEFLDAARNDGIWQKATDALLKVGGNVTMPILVELLNKLVKESIDLLH